MHKFLKDNGDRFMAIRMEDSSDNFEAEDMEGARKLWEISERMVGLKQGQYLQCD